MKQKSRNINRHFYTHLHQHARCLSARFIFSTERTEAPQDGTRSDAIGASRVAYWPIKIGDAERRVVGRNYCPPTAIFKSNL